MLLEVQAIMGELQWHHIDCNRKMQTVPAYNQAKRSLCLFAISESYTIATASISTFAFSGNVLTAKQARAGGSSGKYLPVVTSQEQ